MNTYANKNQVNNRESIVDAVAQKKSKTQSTFQFVDNRPEAIAQRKIQEMANNSPQAKQAIRLQSKANTSSSPSIQSNINPLQMRQITGQITTVNNGDTWNVQPQGASNPPNLSINPSPKVVVYGAHQKSIIVGETDLMRGHLVKAAWQGRNDMEQMTQWNKAIEETAWTQVEAAAERHAVEISPEKSAKAGGVDNLTHSVTTKTKDLNHGDHIFGKDKSSVPVKWLYKQVHANSGSWNTLNNVRTELNRMVGEATMEVEGTEVGNISSNAHKDIKVKG